MNVLCISIDGLHCGMIGAFGNTWIQTPAIDSLAAESVLFDRYYTNTLDLSAVFGTFSNSREQFVKENTRSFLITDDTDVYLHHYSDGFDEKHCLERQFPNSAGNKPVTLLEETQFCKAFAAATDILDRFNPDTETFFLHLHLEGFRSPWDFPLSYRLKHQADEDPMPYPDTAVPDFIDADPDTLQSVMEAYSGGMSVLDEALSGLLEYAADLDDTAVVFFSVRGFSLGEHGKIGANEDIYGENIQLPLMIRYPQNTNAGCRSQTLLLPQDVLPLLNTAEIPEEPDAVHTSLHIGNAAVTADWFYAPPELYVKPDDRWEVNDVADRCRHIAARFQDGSLVD
ncbi:MAG: sulfatase-like hydrolase/transferase [Planctomycetaceae bacterium]|jgi:arylsulfatase A-like enzyme|nr:sulfatase-like hydrolase/transferase [Planctomycetaceae bacterium]